MTNTETLKKFKAGRPVVHIIGAGLPCSIITTLLTAGRLNVRRTGACSVYTLKGSN